MRMPRLALVLLLACLSSAPPAAAEGWVTALEDGVAVEGSLPYRGRTWRTFEVRVPNGAHGLSVVLHSANNLDLYVKQGGPIMGDWAGESTARSVSPAGDETITLTTNGAPVLAAETYYVDVVAPGDVGAAPPAFRLTASLTLDGQGPGAVPAPPVEEEAIDEEISARFADDFQATLQFEPTEAYRTFLMTVEQDVRTVELSVSADEDVDIYVRYDKPMETWEQATWAAADLTNEERIVADRSGAPALRTGRYYIDVARQPDDVLGTSVRFTVRYTRGYDGPEPDTHARPVASTEDDVTAEISEDTSFALEMPKDGPDYRTYKIHIPQSARSLLVQAVGAGTDMDLYLQHGYGIDEWGTDVDHYANGSGENEQIYVDASSTPALEPGAYYLDLVRANPGVATGAFRVTVEFDGDAPKPLPASTAEILDLPLGERTEVRLVRTEQRAARYRIEVPDGAESLHVLVLRANRDLDVFLRHEEEITSYDDDGGYDHAAISERLGERLVVDRDSSPPLRSGTWYLDVASLMNEDVNLGFTVVATVNEAPPLLAGDVRFPPYTRPDPLTALETVMQATVQVACANGQGSGTCVSPTGLIITNHHVLEDATGAIQEDEVFISFPDTFDDEPVQSFEAEVVQSDRQLDLVLLRIVRDIFDRPLPGPLELPWLPIADASRLRHGEPLLVVGYPSVGGEESRSSVSVTRGIVAGFNRSLDGRRGWIKTDARINAGNSGGTALDEEYRYVGIPSRELIEEDDELGFCRPTNLIPDAWRKQIDAALP